MKRKRAFQRSEGERDEDDGGRRQSEPWRPQCGTLGPERRLLFRGSEAPDHERRHADQGEVRQKRAADPADRTQGRPCYCADRVGAEHPRQPPVLLAREPLEHPEDDSEPEPARPDALEQAGRKVHPEAVAQDEPEIADGHAYECEAQDPGGVPPLNAAPGHGVAQRLADREEGDEQADHPGTGSSVLRDRRDDRGDDAVPGRV
jgi:hypothetical protein